MKKIVMALMVISLAVSGCGSIGEAIKKEASNRIMPEKLYGTWEYKGYLGNKLTIDNNDFTMEVYDKTGKLLRKFIGVIKKVDITKKFIAPQLTQMFQGGKNLTHILKGINYKPFYYKELSDNSVDLYIINGYTSEKYLNNHDEDAKIDRKYNKFIRK